jgi:DNA polymerase III epsilon subunit-like protein
MFIDVETFGLDPYNCPVIDIAMVSTDRHGKILKEYSSKIRPSPYEVIRADPKAIEVNGFTVDSWKDAKIKSVVNEEIDKVFEGKYIPIGWNIGFDLSFLDVQFHFDCFSLAYHPLDLMSMAWCINFCSDHNSVVCGCCFGSFNHPGLGIGLHKIERPHLSDCCKMLGVEVKDEHTALGDVNMMI